MAMSSYSNLPEPMQMPRHSNAGGTLIDHPQGGVIEDCSAMTPSSISGGRVNPTPREALSECVTTVAFVDGAGTVVGGVSACPDTLLISLCAELDAMERRIGALFDFTFCSLPDHRLEAADAAAYRIDQDQRRIMDRICSLTPATLDGYSALARSLALLCPGLVDTAPHADMEARLTSTLLRGLTRAA